MDNQEIPQARIETGQRLRQAREIVGLSQGQVARMLGLHRPTISEIEAGRRRITVEEMQEFARIYDVNASWLATGKEENQNINHDPRYHLAARELAKLKPDDVARLLDFLTILRKTRGDEP